MWKECSYSLAAYQKIHTQYDRAQYIDIGFENLESRYDNKMTMWDFHAEKVIPRLFPHQDNDIYTD